MCNAHTTEASIGKRDRKIYLLSKNLDISANIDDIFQMNHQLFTLQMHVVHVL